jgi:hypothetical protein
MTKEKAKVFLHGVMDVSMTVSGGMENNMEKGFSLKTMELEGLVSGRMVET